MILFICLLVFYSVDYKDILVYCFVKYEIKFGSIYYL